MIDLFSLVIIGLALLFIAYLATLYSNHKKETARYANLAQKQNKSNPLIEGVNIGLDQLNKIGEEQNAIMLKQGISQANITLIVEPVRKRYNQLKFIKEHENIVIPILNTGSEIIEKLIKGFI